MKIRDLDETTSPLNDSHEALGLPPLERVIEQAHQHPVLTVAAWFIGLALLSIVLWLGSHLFFPNRFASGMATVQEVLNSRDFWVAVAVGFGAQAIDGALGMAYGISSTTFLLGAGYSPAVASASVHIAEVFTTGLSGLSHFKLGNVDQRLFLRLLVPGILGGVLGAFVVTHIDGSVLKPWVAAYLLLMGIYVLSKAWHKIRPRHELPKHVGKLALFGGFVDAAGGGGWGPVVTTSLVGAGNDPRRTIGSVNFAEFFIALSSAASFALLIDSAPWSTVAGLVVGGVFAAPLAALLCRAFQARTLLILVGLLISSLSAWNLYSALH